MDENKIEKGSRHVAFQLSNGNRIAGKVFLSLFGEHHPGPENMEDLLNKTKKFIPVETGTEVLLLNMDHIVLVEIEAASEENDLMRLGTKHWVWVKTILGEELQGEIFISFREGHARVNDHMNEVERFFRLFQPGYILYINRKSILFIHD